MVSASFVQWRSWFALRAAWSPQLRDRTSCKHAWPRRNVLLVAQRRSDTLTREFSAPCTKNCRKPGDIVCFFFMNSQIGIK